MVKLHKVMVCGMKSVGKTLILEKAIYDTPKNNEVIYPTIEDTYIANVETDKGVKEMIRFYDTAGIDHSLSPMSSTGDQNAMINACGQLARQYNGIVDGYILVYSILRMETLDCIITMKKEIDKIRDKKEGLFIVIGHNDSQVQSPKSTIDTSQPTITKALNWCAKEKIKHFQASVQNRSTLFEPLTYLVSKLSSAPNKSTFPQLTSVRKTNKTDFSN